MRSLPASLRFLFAALSLFIAPAVWAEPDVAVPRTNVAEHVVVPARFMRFVDDGHAGGKFETAVLTLKNKDGVVVRLVGAVHIGEKSYYEGLNKSFESDDAVLYELVRPKGGGIPQPGQKSDNLINQIQHLMKDVLHLDFQLDDIDYSKPNFVHADMDAETFTKMQKERGETFEQMMLKQIMKAFSNDGSDKDKPGEQIDTQKVIDGVIELFTRPDMERQIKVAFAKQLDKMEDSALGLDNPNGSVIVTERNKVCMKVLENTVASGKRRISVFYGAAHLPDMVTRAKEMGFKPVALDWTTAWDLTIRPNEPSGAEKLLKELFRAFDDN